MEPLIRSYCFKFLQVQCPGKEQAVRSGKTVSTLKMIQRDYLLLSLFGGGEILML